MSAVVARVQLRQDDLEAAQRWARHRGLSLRDELSYRQEYEHITLARVLLQAWDGQMDAAGNELLAFLQRLAAAVAGGRLGSETELLLLQALVHRRAGRQGGALARLEQALERAEPEGYAAVFLEGGPVMAVCSRRRWAGAWHPPMSVTCGPVAGPEPRASHRACQSPSARVNRPCCGG
ncbi:tetratricopeptide repeat protein [Deinococcus aquaedulcis]|uniref:hypothetical protein n=1 Tax=Deinococcus aquaedulcis TaxID=2840455 RepID=UPI001C82D3AF|nr:hypothetical protein [Deinococcus aquaedulcis]